MRWWLLLIVLAMPVWAVTVRHDGTDYVCDDVYSFRDFTGHNLSAKTDMNGRTICRSVFSNEMPDAAVLPPTLTGVTFVGCNLDNVLVPAGNTVVAGSRRRFRVQNDREDWGLNAEQTPIAPLDRETFEQLGISTNPRDIPATPLTQPRTQAEREARANAVATAQANAERTVIATRARTAIPPPTSTPRATRTPT